MDLPPRANLSVKEISSFLGISPQKVYELVSSGAIPSKRIGRVIKIPRADFERWWEKIPSAADSLGL